MMQERRAIHIEQIKTSLKKAIEENRNFDFKSTVLATMANLNLSRRIAKDYVEVAYFKLGINTKDGQRTNPTDAKTNTE